MKPLSYLLLPLFPVTLLACGDDGEESVDTTPFSLEFQAVVGETPFSCDQTYPNIGTTSETLTITDLRFYASNFRVIDQSGVEHQVELTQDGAWQLDDVALLDFENNSGFCQNGTSETNYKVTGTHKAPNVKGVIFDIGVPESLNHSDSATMPSPLNLTSMWWNWQGGYKFMRIEGASDSLEGWRLHLGSTECEGDPGQSISCQKKNRPTIRFESGLKEDSKIVFDVAAMLATSDLSKDDGGPVGCMAGGSDPECGPLFETLGLTGNSQSSFSLK